MKSREVKSRESANEPIYGDAPIINYGFIIIAPNSRDSAFRLSTWFIQWCSVTHTNDHVRPSAFESPSSRCAGEADAEGSLIYHCIRFRTCSDPFIAARSYIPSKVTRGTGYESCSYVRVCPQWRRCEYTFVRQIARIESSMISGELGFRCYKCEETD